jgi:hypothetical protein
MGATHGSLIDPIGSGMTGEGSIQHLPKEWIIGRDMTIVEKPVVCKDGDSIQGSYVASESGCYVLQWKWFEGKMNSGFWVFRSACDCSFIAYSTEFMDSLTGTSKASSNLIDFPTFAHKSKLMYYTEMLNSEDFRGKYRIVDVFIT